MTLNQKIEIIIKELGFSSSKFADHIGVSRPIISHIIAGRNRPSLEIIQKILMQFPQLGVQWTFDEHALNLDLLKIIAEDAHTENEDIKEAQADLFSANAASAGEKEIVKIVVFYDDNSFTDFKSSNVGAAMASNSVSSSLNNDAKYVHQKMISKIVLFYNDNSFSDFKPA